MVIDGNFFPAQYSHMESGPRKLDANEMRPENIGKRLTILREAFGLSKSEMADLLGIERTYWSRFENGKRPVNSDVAYLLVDRFDVTLDFLILGRWEKLNYEVAEKLRAAIAKA